MKIIPIIFKINKITLKLKLVLLIDVNKKVINNTKAKTIILL